MRTRQNPSLERGPDGRLYFSTGAGIYRLIEA
jgi:hypothetical protein